MSRIMVVSGVHLDRAWPELGSAFGERVARNGRGGAGQESSTRRESTR